VQLWCEHSRERQGAVRPQRQAGRDPGPQHSDKQSCAEHPRRASGPKSHQTRSAVIPTSVASSRTPCATLRSFWRRWRPARRSARVMTRRFQPGRRPAAQEAGRPRLPLVGDARPSAVRCGLGLVGCEGRVHRRRRGAKPPGGHHGQEQLDPVRKHDRHDGTGADAVLGEPLGGRFDPVREARVGQLAAAVANTRTLVVRRGAHPGQVAQGRFDHVCLSVRVGQQLVI
jgi:hypothetical protein